MATLLIQLMSKLQSLRSDERGQGLVEYALILVLVSIAAIVMLGQLGTDVGLVFTAISNALTGATP